MASRRKTCRKFRGPRMRRCCTPLNPAGGESALIRGRQAILDFFNSILPAVRSVKFLHYYTDNDEWVAGQAEIGLANGKTLYVFDAFRIENHEILEQQNHYDPRPAGIWK